MSISITTYLSTITFFIGVFFILVVFFKKPTKTHVEEMKEAGNEVVAEITQSAEILLSNIQKKKEDMEVIKAEVEERLKTLEKKEEFYKKLEKDTIQKENIETQVSGLVKQMAENKKVSRQKGKVPSIGMEKKKAIISMYKQGYPLEEIAKKWELPKGVIQLLIEVEIPVKNKVK